VAAISKFRDEEQEWKRSIVLMFLITPRDAPPSVPDTSFLMKYRHNQILFKVFSFTSKTLFVVKYEYRQTRI
jgi:hypothetical protein